MGWRDRVKKSFGDFEDIGEGIQNLKNPEKKEKRGLKVTFKRYPQNTQNPQNGPDEGGKSKKPNPDTPRMVKPQNTPEPTPAAIPAPSPAGLGAEYEALWNEAWILADRIDDPDGAPIEDKLQSVPPTAGLKKIPELPDDLIQSPAVWIRTDKPIWTPATCPARCKWAGRCYGIAYFNHKPGKSLDCQGDQCPWME